MKRESLELLVGCKGGQGATEAAWLVMLVLS
jgi:hypothetical protein